ncbi:MAG: IS21-like element helper ATPase IstB [Bacteroidales bacterium]
MESKTQVLTEYTSRLKLSGIKERWEDIIKQAEHDKLSYTDFSLMLLKAEIHYRDRKDMERRMKAAKLPLMHDLNQYDHTFNNGLSKQQLNQLRDCLWLEQNFNLILMGPSGTGKTLIAAGLCYDALKNGYKAYFRTMEQLADVLKLKDLTRSATTEYNRLIKAHLVVIDDIMMFSLNKQQAVALFNFINNLHERASFIVTTNKSPEEWVKLLDDEVIATAILDRLLYHCEVVKLDEKSYRLLNRKKIFETT